MNYAINSLKCLAHYCSVHGSFSLAMATEYHSEDKGEEGGEYGGEEYGEGKQQGYGGKGWN